jgi:hypothetical protein
MFHCGKHFSLFKLGRKFSMDLCTFHSLRRQKTHSRVLLVLGADLWWSSRLYATLTRHRRTTAEPHSQHSTVVPCATARPGLSSVANHTTKIFQYCPYFFIIVHSSSWTSEQFCFLSVNVDMWMFGVTVESRCTGVMHLISWTRNFFVNLISRISYRLSTDVFPVSDGVLVTSEMARALLPE